MNNKDESLGEFDDTRWSMIRRVQECHAQARHFALNDLLKVYVPALRAHLVIKRGLDRQDAWDIVQGFVTDKMIERDLVATADPAKGRFRSLLLKSLEYYLIDADRKKKALKRKPRLLQSIETDDSATTGIGIPVHDADVFEAAWAREVLTEAVRRLREHCQTQRQPHIWEVFRLRILKPALDNTRPPTYEELVAQCKLASPSRATSAIKTAKQRFERILSEVIVQHSLPEESLDDQLASLRAILATAGSLGLDDPDESLDEISLSEQSLSRLAPILQPDRQIAHPWSVADLGQIYRHLLSLPLADATSELFDKPAADSQAEQPLDLQLSTLGDALFDPKPPLDLLKRIKRGARKRAKEPRGDLPSEIATVVYYVTIAAALARLQVVITKLNPGDLKHGLAQMVCVAWIDERTRDLLREAADSVHGADAA